jgi:hypothetical protein
LLALFSRLKKGPGYLEPGRRLERSWSFDSNRDLVERDITITDDEEEKGSLQVKGVFMYTI